MKKTHRPPATLVLATALVATKRGRLYIREVTPPPGPSAQDTAGQGDGGAGAFKLPAGVRLGQPLTEEVLKLLSDNLVTGVSNATRDTLLGEPDAQAVKRIPVGSSVAHSLDDNTRGHMLNWLKCAKLDKPARFSGESGEHAERGRRLRGFLREVKRYLLITDLEKSCWGLVAAHFLEGAALDVWELELDALLETEGLTAVTWDKFESCLTEQYASLMPAREARATYDALVQRGSVADYVIAFRQSLRELAGTQFHPAGSALLDFIKGLKHVVRDYVQDNAPEGWYQSVEQAYLKAQNYEYNKQAAVRVVDPQRGSHSQSNSSPARKSRPNSDSSKHSKGNKQPDATAGKRTASTEPKKASKRPKPAKAKAGPDDNEWAARIEAGKCPACGLTGHKFKVKGELQCPNLKNAAPHSTITDAKPNPHF